ncbi:MAG: 7-cyano-7-deazaguanine synthase QueC [Gammaproteobacteria bacterium]|nr:7-cyano-7-deazaguanine synthase QueC [Gammaproteobacteria bacterium]
MTKAVILLSGGLDSATCLAIAHSLNYDCYAMSFHYGQKQSAELEAARRLAQHYAVVAHQVLNISALSGSSLTDAQYEIEDHRDTSDIPMTYVPARNTIMLALALGWAEVLEADRIIIGVSAIDYSNYPDCRPEYIEAFQRMALLATRRGVEGHGLVIDTPLIHKSKAQTIQLGLSVGLDYAQTVSCYRANVEGLACGTCSSCHFRKKGFQEAAVVDPTRYLV